MVLVLLQIPGPITRELAAEKETKDTEKRREINRKKKERLKVMSKSNFI